MKLTQPYIDSIGVWFYHKPPLPANYFSSQRKMIQDYGKGKAIKVAAFEWNYTDGGDAAFRSTMQALEGGLFCARTHNFFHRNCDLVEIANRSNFCNATYAGFIQTDRARLYKTPVYYVQQLYAAHASNGKPLVVEGATGSGMDLSAVLSAGQDKVTLFVANLTRESIKKELDLSAFGKTGQTLKLWVVADRDHANDPAVVNSFTDLERICSRPGTYAAPSPRFEYEFPPLSFTVLEWVVQK
jgi:alpha-L-arabinofuranosidase